jgi:transposase
LLQDCGLDEKTVRNVFREHAEHLDATTTFATPKWLGIDEVTLVRQPRCIMTNLQERTIIALLRNRNHSTVTHYLNALHSRERVEIVAMDMWTPYRDAVRSVLPRARIIVDKFHVVRMANQGLEVNRKETRKTLTERQRRALMHDRFVLLRRAADLTDKDRLILQVWTQQMPLLAQAYRFKEQFCDIWALRQRSDAEQAYAAWRALLPTELESAFQPLLTAIGNWHDEIFGYFAVPGASITNATTEALNGLAQVIWNTQHGSIILRSDTEESTGNSSPGLSRKHSFGALRASLLYYSEALYVYRETEQRSLNVGVSIPALTRWIAQGNP